MLLLRFRECVLPPQPLCLWAVRGRVARESAVGTLEWFVTFRQSSGFPCERFLPSTLATLVVGSGGLNAKSRARILGLSAEWWVRSVWRGGGGIEVVPFFGGADVFYLLWIPRCMVGSRRVKLNSTRRWST
jgi:hypothetical protein